MKTKVIFTGEKSEVILTGNTEDETALLKLFSTERTVLRMERTEREYRDGMYEPMKTITSLHIYLDR